MIAVDTNILLYAIDPSAGAKNSQAKLCLYALSKAGCGCFPLKTIEEFFYVVKRKAITSLDLCRQFIEQQAQSFTFVDTLYEDVLAALDVSDRGQLSFWDAIVFATAKRAGCSIMLSEDGPSDATINGITWINPFGPKGLQHPKLKRLLA